MGVCWLRTLELLQIVCLSNTRPDYSNTNQCLDENVYLPVNHDMDHHPVFLKPKRNGTLEEDKPLASHAFTDEMKRTDEACGLETLGVSYYSWRRETLTSFIQKFGKDLGREVVAHASDSTAYHSYDFGIGNLDAAAARLTESGADARTREAIRRSEAPAFINRVDDAQNRRIAHVEIEIRKRPEFIKADNDLTQAFGELTLAAGIQHPYPEINTLLREQASAFPAETAKLKKARDDK